MKYITHKAILVTLNLVVYCLLMRSIILSFYSKIKSMETYYFVRKETGFVHWFEDTQPFNRAYRLFVILWLFHFNTVVLDRWHHRERYSSCRLRVPHDFIYNMPPVYCYYNWYYTNILNKLQHLYLFVHFYTIYLFLHFILEWFSCFLPPVNLTNRVNGFSLSTTLLNPR